MKTTRTLFGAPLLALPAILAILAPPAITQSTIRPTTDQVNLLAFASLQSPIASPASSSSLSGDPVIPEPPAAAGMARFYPAQQREASYRPFLSYAMAFRLGTGGLGGEIATPLARRIDLRVGAEAFTYSTTFNTNGLIADGTLKLGETFATLDYHPFNNGFRLSPGLTMYNRNNVAATLNVPGGNTFTLNDVDYTSEASDPITGTAGATFGHKVAPRFTLGWANTFPRFGGHWSFPVELGFYYTSNPAVAIALNGSACSTDGCGSINTPENEANIEGERAKINNDLAPARFFPVLSFGVGYRFGH